MAGTNMNEINIPVRLKVLQDSIDDFQKILDSLQPETKGWRSVSRIIAQMTSEAQRFQVQISKPFSSEKQFDQAEKSIDKLEESAERLKIVINGLTITDLKLNPDQLKELQQYEKEINDIKTSYKQLQEEAKKKLLDNGNNKELLGAIPDKQTLSRSFSGIQAAVNQHVNDLEKGVEEQKKLFDQLKSNIELGTRATILTSSKQGLTREALGDSIFDKFLRKTEEGTLQLKTWNNGVTKKALLEEIEKAFDLSPGDLQHLASKKVNEINEEFQKMGEKGDLNPFSGIITKGKNEQSNYDATLAALEQQLNEYKALQAEINNLQKNELDPADVINTGKIQEVTDRLNGLRKTIIGNIITNDNYKSSMKSFSTGLGQARTAIQETSAEFLRMEQIRNSFNSMKTMVANFMGFNQILNLTRKAVQEAAQHIKELDTVMNGISIVTNMDTSDLWGQIDQYSKMAQTYGTTIKGAYEVSQIYYQQGLETADVLTLTNETLKLAKVSGLDYASTTDYMTTALRGFKMEMSEASTVVDVYSNLAAHTAVSQEELAVAMSKTASSMESVGSSFEETSAMIATMVAVTRESATNIGSALKSIAARYGEMKSDPLAMTDADGEELVYNKVDAALQSVGITLKDTEGQFRNFTDVITELAEKWDTLESTQQRYIATQFAGNRQQSRFLALISNKDLLAENIAVAENSADVGTAQALKALDSLESKIEQVRVAYQQFYTTIGIESVWKGFLDGAKSVINTLNGMPKLFGKLPLAALNAIAQVITLIKNVAFAGLAKLMQQLGPILVSGVTNTNDAARSAGESWVDSLLLGIKGKSGEITGAGELINSYLQKGLINKGLINGKELNRFQNYSKKDLNDQNIRDQIGKELKTSGFLSDTGFQHFTQDGKQAAGMLQAFIQQAQIAQSRTTVLGNAVQSAGQLFAGLALVIDTTTQGGKAASGAMTAFGGAVSMLGIIVANLGKELNAIPWYAVASAALSIITGIIQLWNANSIEAQLEEVTAKAEELNNKAKELKANYNTLDNSIKKLQELEKTRYDSAEAAEEYQTAVDKLAETYPQLISSYDEQNRAVLNVNSIERVLAQARDETADATLRAAQAEALRLKTEQENQKNNLHLNNDALQKVVDSLYLEQAFSSSDYDSFFNPFSRQLSNINTKTPITNVYKDSYTRTYGEQLSGFIAAINDAAEQNKPDLVLSTFESLQNFLDKNLFQLDKSLMDPIRELVNAAKDYYKYDERIDTANRLLVSSQLDYEYRGTKSQSSLKNSQGLFDRATQYLYEKINSTSKDFSPENISHEAKKIVSKVDSLFIGITDTRRKELENILEHPESYNVEDLPDELKEIGWIKEAYKSSAASSVEDVNNKLNDLLDQESKTALTNEEVEKFRDLANQSNTLNLRNLTNAGIKQAQALKKSGQNPNEFIGQFIEFYNQVATLPANLRNSIIENFTANGFTKEGLQKTQDWLNSDEIKAQLNGRTVNLEPMIDSFVPNLSLTLQTMNDAITENLGDYESLFSDLSGGIKGSKLSKTIASAEKLLGIKLKFDEFVPNGEQFILSVDRFDDAIAALKTKFGENINDYTDEIDEISKAIQTGKITDESQQKLILGADYATYFNEAGQLKEGVNSDQVADELLSRGQTLVTLYNDYQALSDAVLDQLKKTSEWKKGNYDETLGTGAYEKIESYATGAYDQAFYENPDWANAVEMYQSGMSSAVSDLTTYGVEYVKGQAELGKYKGVNKDKLADEITKSGENGLVSLTEAWAKRAGKSVSEINSLVIKAIDLQTGRGKNKAASELISGGSFTSEDLNQFLSSYFPKDNITDYINSQTNELKGALGNVYQFDEATASFKIKDTATFEDVIKAYEETFKTTITKGDELYNQLYKDWIDNKIKGADKKDSGKQFASVLSTLSSAKVGTRVSLVDSPKLKAALERMGIKIENDTYEVMSEYARDNLILALESTDAEVNAVLNPLKESINQKRAKGAAQKGVMSKTFTRENFRNYLKYATIRGGRVDNYSDQYLNDIAESHGFNWSEELQQYVLTNYTKAIEWYDSMIKEAVDQEKDPEYIKQLRQERGQIITEFNKDEKYEALSNLLTNYEDAGNYIEDINTQFGIDLRTVEGAVTKVDGKEVIDKDKVKTALETKLGDAADQYSFLFDNLTDQIADTYIDNISKAGTLAMTGTSSQVEMEGFKKAFQRIFPNEEPTFIYDALLNSWTLDINDAIRMIEESAKNITFGSEADRQAYIQNQIDKLFADNLDFSKFLSGTATENEQKKLQDDLQKYFIAHAKKYGVYGSESTIKTFAEARVKQTLETLSKGGAEAVKKLQDVKDGKATSDELKAAYDAQIAPIRAAAEVVDSLQVGSFVATEQIDALTKAGFTIENNTVVATAENLTEAYKSLYNQMAETGEATISELNNLAAQGLDSQYKLPRSVSDTLSKGTMSFSELTQLYTNAGKTFGDTGRTNEAGQAIYDYTAELERLKTEGKIAVDALGNVKVTNFQGLAAELGFEAGTEEYAAAYSKFVDSVISDRSNTSSGRARTQLSNLISAKVGDAVNVTDLPANIKTKLGIMGSDAIEIVSEAQRDNWILALDATEESDEAVKQAILEAQKSIKAKRNLSTNTAAVVAMKVSQSAAENLATALGQDTTEAARIMEERGYVFNEYTQEWKASTEVLKNLNRDLYIASQSGATAEDIANLEAAYNNLKYELQNQKYNAVQDIVNNYQNLSEESIAAFKTAFAKTKINITDYITTDEWGKNVVDLAALNQKLVEVGYDVNQLFQQEITSIGDAYLKNISTGVSLLSKGTNNLSDIGTFVESYNEVMGTNLTAGQVTYYDEVLKAFTIQPDFIREYIAKQGENLKAQGIIPEDRVDQWIQDNTVELARQNVDIKGFLSGERTQNDINKLGKALETYYEFAKEPFDKIQNLINNDIKGLQQGGAVAVNIAKSINPELTETDLAEIYSSAIKGWNEALSSAENLTIGQVVTGELKQVLSGLNMIDANGVVTSVENMAGVYWQIFHQMQLTAGSTLTELNKAYAKALEAKESEESKPVEMIKNAASMSYTQLGEYLADSGVQLWDVLRQEVKYGIEALGGGKVRISDFTAFADAMGWETDTEEYIEAFKSYNDSLINYRNQTKTQMQAELQALSQITTSGDVNITRIASEYNLEQYLPTEDLEKYGATLKNGILSLNESADIAGLTEKLGQLVIAEGGMTEDELNKLINDIEVQTKLRDSDNKKKINTAAAYKDIFSNYNSLSIEMIGNLATQLGTTYEDIIDKLDLKNQQADGTYKVSLTKLRQVAKTAEGELQQQLLEQVADIENNILSSITSAGGFAREGTSSMSEMQKFINEYNTLTGENATLADSFIYDGALKAFTLTPQMLTKYIEVQKKQLEELGLSDEGAIEQYIKDQTENISRENINIESLLSAQGTAERNVAATELARQIQQLSNYSDIQKLIGKNVGATIDETMNAIYSVLSAGGDQAVELVKAIKGEKVTASDISTAYNAGIERLRTALNELQVHTGAIVSDYTAAILNAVGIETKDLENGTSVVTTLDTNIKVDQLTQAYAALYNALKQSNEKTITDLNAAYAKMLTSAESQEINAISTLQNAVSMTWEQLGEILTQEGKYLEDVFNDMAAYGVGSIGAGKVRIYDFTKFAEQMGWDPSSDEYVSAYKAYNDGLIALNNQAEKAIVEEVKSLSSAKGGDWLNFTQLWAALQNATKTAIENIAPENYMGNVDLANRPIVPAETMKKVFKNFEGNYATLYSQTFMSENLGDLENSVGLLFTSITSAGEPVADLASYVKGLYEEAEGDVEKIRQLDARDRNLFLYGLQNTTAKEIDEYAMKLHDRGAAKDTIRYYNQALENYGARFVDGIFQLDSNANLFGVASTLHDLIDSGVIKIEDGLAEIEDAISDILKAYANAISKGIEGGLTNVEKQDLIQKASDLGLSDIKFEETAEGFKLVETSAIQLYYALKQIDSLQAGQIFDKLRESLEKTNENFKSSSALAAHITKIRNGTYAADDKISQARKDQYQAELDIAKEILAVRATSEDSSFNFMSNSIPAAQNNPLNYFSNWASAIEKIKTAMKTTTKDTKGKSHKGLIDYQDWYNIVTEMNNIAALGGEFEVAGVKLNGSMKAAAELIQKGANALVATKTGDLKVAMGDIGVEFKAGAGGMKQGIDDGIKAMAQSQIDMLDGMIQMLETIVAMEKLGDIAGKDDVIDIGDILPKIEWDENGNPIEDTFEEFNKDYKSIVGYILDAAKDNEDLNKGLENLKINNKSIKEIFGMDASTLANMGKDFNEAYAAALQAMVTAARSGNYDENNVMQSLQEVFAESGLNNITLDTGKMSIVLTGGTISTITWEDENVKKLLEKYKKEDITAAMQNFLSGTVTQQEIEIALTVKGVYKLNEKGKIESIEWNGTQYDVNTEAFKKAQAAHLLKQLKVITDEKEFDLSELAGKDGQYTTTYTIGEGQRNIQVNIKSDENGITTTFHSNKTGKDYNSAQALYVDEYNYLANEEYKKTHDNQTATEEQLKDFKKSKYTYDMYMWQVNTIHANTKTVVESEGETIDLNSQGSQGARDALLDVYNQSAEDFEKWAKDSKNVRVTETGDIEANVGDYKIVLNGKGIVQPDNKIDYSEYQAAIGKDLLGADLSLQENIAGGIVKGISSLSSSFGEAATAAGSLADAMERISKAAQMLQATQWGVIAEGIKSLNSPKEQQKNSSSSSDSQTTSTETTNVTTIVTKFEPDTKAVDDAKKEISEKPTTITVDGDPTSAIETSERAKAIINTMQASINITASNSANNVITNIQNALNKLVNGGPYKVTVQASVSAGSKGNLGGGIIRNGAKESNLEHSANAKGTLMGELGPELVVSKGRYFVVGQNGPEMVDLDDDAIVFNHLQTQSLLTKGMSNGRGRAVTNERNAVSFATGNVDGGPAMASAAAALAALKQLRAMWESLLNASVSDIAGGGGGGGGGGNDKIVDPKAWVKTVERWYNLTQEIAKLEKDITHEETLRSKLQSDFSKNGKHYYNSQRLSLKALREQIAAQEQLNLSRQDYYKKRIDTLKNEPLGKLYTFDEQGQMHFRDDVTMNGQKGAMNFLTDLMGFDENGKANYTNEQKYNILKQYGFDEYMKYNSNGEQILLDADHSGDVTDEERETYYQQATEAWRDRMDNFASETQSLWDSIQEGENNLLELQADQNEILQEMRDNQMAVEEDVLKAIEDMRQREIDALQDERDKLEDSTGKYIEGLSDALSKEQEMYDNQQQENDLNQQRRRLAILQRSGGSAADIANLQNEINSNERSRYFDLQQQQIDAIQQASDLQLERMDNQIELMTETLEYQKEYGLLWSEVYDVMSHSAAQITSFIMNGNSEFWTKSPLGSVTSANDTLFKADQWVEFRKDMTDVTTDVANLAFAANEQKKANDYKIYNDAMIKEFGKNYDSKGKYKGIFEQVYDETGDITKASAAARAEYQKDKKAEEAKKSKTTTTTTSTSAPSSVDSSSGSSNNNKCKGCAGECTKGCSYSCVGQCGKNSCKDGCKTGCNTTCTKTCKGGPNDIDNPAKYQGTNRSSIPKKAVGGFVKHGIYELGEKGTEGIFNARQTRILRDNILSNKPNSLITLLNTYNEAYKDGISVAPQEASGQLIIENATVNMNVEQIANDYDARRAGEQALNEMMRIARKTGAANSIRR